MALSQEVIVEEDGWTVKEMVRDGELSHYVLEYELDEGHSSVPFDEVRASGGLLALDYNSERSIVFTGVIDGLNQYLDDSDMPEEVFQALKEVGPY